MSLAIPSGAALWFLPFVTPVCLWVIWTDLTRMKIPNRAVAALFAIYALVGPLALPFDLYAWQWLNLPVVLGLGFVFFAAGAMGAGDAKFIAVMAPFVTLADASVFLRLYIAASLAALLVHRLALALPASGRIAADWESWKRQHPGPWWKQPFPKGTALGVLLIAYLALGAISGG
ncbi:MAG: prepilin peptidase [Tropicimonas sp.]|uniref:prepilin peptidase n=1 Tax=Tropicimonas sp. TaxID=2067044 RepID=UPI003A8A3BCD